MFAELPGPENYLQRTGHRLCIHGVAWQAVRKMQKAEDTVPLVVHLDRERAPKGERLAKACS